MNDVMTSASPFSPRMPWNKGKLIGAKPPLRLKHVWAIRSTLQLSGRIRDLALFNLGIDSKRKRDADPTSSAASCVGMMRGDEHRSI